MTKPKTKNRKIDQDRDGNNTASSQENRATPEMSPGQQRCPTPLLGCAAGIMSPSAGSSRASPGGANSGTTAPPPHRPSPIAWFTSHVQAMMHGFGDCRKPLVESARLVEEITHQQMNSLLMQLTEIATLRGTKIIGLEDILYLLRKDRVKLSRLIRYVTIKDRVSNLKGGGAGEDDAAAEEGTATAQQQQQGGGEAKGAVAPSVVKSRRRKTCYDFISSIDQTGEMLSLFEEDAFDEVKLERELRADWQARDMEADEYLQFAESRRVSFCQKTRVARFRDWLLRDNLTDCKLNAVALETLNYMAYETVAQIVDLSLLVKRDMNTASGDCVEKLLPTGCMSEHYPSEAKSNQITSSQSPHPSPPTSPLPSPGVASQQQQQTNAAAKAKNKKRKKSCTGTQECETPYSATILPADIREAMRRYMMHIGPFYPFSKVHKSYLTTRILCM